MFDWTAARADMRAIRADNEVSIAIRRAETTLTAQLTRMIHSAENPAFAPNVVVAMSSPEPTIDAVRIKPGPSNRMRARHDSGGSATNRGSRT